MLGLIATGCLVGAVAASPPTAAAATTYTARASAEGVRVTPYAGGAPVANEPVEVGSPVSQATFDSLGTSQAFASALYPGDLLVSLPGLIAGVSNGQLNLPNYPMIAISDQETAPDKQVAAPGVTMRASSSDSGSVATTTVGSVTATAATEVTRSGDVISKSESVVTGLTTELLKIGNIRSTARVVLSPDGAVQRSSSFEVSGLEVAGVKVAVGNNGLVLGDAKAPLPSAADLEEALAQAGIQLRLLASVETGETIEGQGLEITVIRDIGGPVTPVALRLGFGKAVASIGRTGSDLVAAPLPAPGPSPAGSAEPTPGSPEPAVLPPPAESAVGPVTGSVPPIMRGARRSAGVATGSLLPSPAGEAGVAVAAPPPTETEEAAASPPSVSSARPSSPVRLVSAAVRFDTRDSYLVLAAIAGLAGAGVFLVARFGVRL